MGVGAFLYLRRIFEKLIFEQFEQAKLGNNIDEQAFNEAKTQDKVKILHETGYVPIYLAEINPFIYAILSAYTSISTVPLTVGICLPHSA
jgi:hypothetical protein